MVFVIYEVPCLACEPEDIYEDISSVTIHKIYNNYDDAVNYMNTLVDEYNRNNEGYFSINIEEIDGYKKVVYMTNDHTHNENTLFNELNGCVFIIIEKDVE